MKVDYRGAWSTEDVRDAVAEADRFRETVVDQMRQAVAEREKQMQRMMAAVALQMGGEFRLSMSSITAAVGAEWHITTDEATREIVFRAHRR